jgi:hypothetical protein
VVFPTGAEIDQGAGLLSLREREPFWLCGTALPLAALAQNAIFGVRAPDVVTRKAVVAVAAFMLPGGLQRGHDRRGGAARPQLIKRRCTGEVTFAELLDELAKSYAAPREEFWRTSALFCAAWPTKGSWSCDSSHDKAFGSVALRPCWISLCCISLSGSSLS